MGEFQSQGNLGEYFRPWLQAAVAAEYTFPFPPLAKQRPGAYFETKQATRDFEAFIAEATSEQLDKRLMNRPLGINLVFLVPQLYSDIDNFIKSVWDGMNGLAYKDDSMFDYTHVVRCIRPDLESRGLILVEILQIDLE